MEYFITKDYSHIIKKDERSFHFQIIDATHSWQDLELSSQYARDYFSKEMRYLQAIDSQTVSSILKGWHQD